MSWKIESKSHVKTCAPVAIPKGTLLYWYKFQSVQNAVEGLDAEDKGIW
jgi:hypothetical protein